MNKVYTQELSQRYGMLQKMILDLFVSTVLLLKANLYKSGRSC